MTYYEMKKVDLSTLIGILSSLIIFFVSVSFTSDVRNYISFSSLFLVLGLTITASCACFSIRDLVNAFFTSAEVIIQSPANPNVVAIMGIKSSEICYKKGLMKLDKKMFTLPLKHKLFLKWMNFLVDNEKPELIESLITQEIYSYHEDKMTVSHLIRRASELAPACGLIGTIVGLVQMLSSINDINNIGQGLSVALLTTLYGAIFSYLILIPLASKLEKNLKEDILNLTIMQKIVLSIATKENPRNLESTINSILPPGKKIIYYHY
ncbi:MAG: MotA/TolQ/ExbB proton channel family protein [Rickettsiaceae bacterium]|nr:MotA/TolQ/ExbB proton channel family protein [Rickettsiaceae bacterium]